MIKALLLYLKTKFPLSRKQQINWLVRNLWYGSIFRRRRFDLKAADGESNIWADIGRHFHYVSEYYNSSSILKSPVVSATMFDRNAPKHELLDKDVERTIKGISAEWANCFMEDSNNIENWLSLFGAIMKRAETLNNNFAKSMGTNDFIEFGPGLGGAAQFYSKHYKINGLLFDLPEVTDLRSVLNQALENKSENKGLLFEEFTELDALKQRLQTSAVYNFISTWAFTEAPLELREKFFEILQKAKVILIVSNSNFEEIDNFLYLNNLSKRLPNHSHTFCNLQFLTAALNFQKRHQLHLFIQQN